MRHNNGAESPPTPGTWITAQELANRLKVHKGTVLRLAREHVIPCWRHRQIVRFRVEEVEDALLRPGRRG